MVFTKGTFVAGDGHEMEGGFTMTSQQGGVAFETSADFYFDGSPEPGFALTTGTPTFASDPQLLRDVSATRFLNLPGGVVPVNGPQVATIPDSIQFEDFDTVVLWCYRYPFILGYGRMEPA